MTTRRGRDPLSIPLTPIKLSYSQLAWLQSMVVGYPSYAKSPGQRRFFSGWRTAEALRTRGLVSISRNLDSKIGEAIATLTPAGWRRLGKEPPCP